MNTERRSFLKPNTVISATFSISLLILVAVLLMSNSPLDRLLAFLTCLPLSGFSYAWLWRERRIRLLRWATISFGSAVSLWFLLFFLFIFQDHDERRGLILVAANLFVNFLIFWLLNRLWKKRCIHAKAVPELAVL